MATVVWLGSPGGPEIGEWGGREFPKDKAVEIEADWPHLERLSKHKFFKVVGYDEAATKHNAPVTHRPPSEQSAQGPVPKAGEPVIQEKFQEAKSEDAKEPEDSKEPEDEPIHPAVAAVHRAPPARRKT